MAIKRKPRKTVQKTKKPRWDQSLRSALYSNQGFSSDNDRRPPKKKRDD